MDYLTHYLDLIAAACPSVDTVGARLHTSDGQFNDIVFAGDLVFRFPRSPQVAELYPNQAALLAHLGARLPLPVPAPVCGAPDAPEWRRRFYGYRRIPGEPLHADLLCKLGPLVTVRLALQLAGFLCALHRLPAGDLPAALPHADRPADWERLYRGIVAGLFPHMRPDARRAVDAQFERFLRDAGQHAFAPALRHGDFGGANILYDPQAQAAAGVIDFESIALGDPAADVASLSCYGEPFIEAGLPAYPEMAAMLARARFYRSTFALQEAYYGLRDGDQRAFRSGMAEYV